MSVVAEPVVVVDGLVKSYGSLRAVDGMTFSVARGTLVAVLGPNGAGKTTTIECCEGFRRPDAGTVRVLGLDPVRDGAALRPRVGVMLQSGGVYQALRAIEVLRHVARLYARPLPLDLLVERLGIDAASRTPVRRLSGGERQRLSLALAVVGRPELVFLDEPTAGLDPQARLATWGLVGDLRADGVTVVLTTHLMDEAEQLADHVVIVDHGRVVAAGTPQELASTGGEDALRFDGPAGLDVAGLAASLPPGTAVSETEPGRYLVDGPASPALVAAVTAWCASRGVMVSDLGVARRSLEDVFLDLTGRGLRT